MPSREPRSVPASPTPFRPWARRRPRSSRPPSRGGARAGLRGRDPCTGWRTSGARRGGRAHRSSEARHRRRHWAITGTRVRRRNSFGAGGCGRATSPEKTNPASSTSWAPKRDIIRRAGMSFSGDRIEDVISGRSTGWSTWPSSAVPDPLRDERVAAFVIRAGSGPTERSSSSSVGRCSRATSSRNTSRVRG